MSKTESLLDCTAVSARKGPFWQQNITSDKKLFITYYIQIYYILIKWEVLESLWSLISVEKLDLILGMTHAGPAFA